MKRFALLIACGLMLTAKDKPKDNSTAPSEAVGPQPVIPIELQTSWRNATLQVNMAQAELDVAQARLKLLQFQKVLADQSNKIYATCGEDFQAQIPAPDAPLVCAPKPKVKEK